jgi:hypothetical protein
MIIYFSILVLFETAERHYLAIVPRHFFVDNLILSLELGLSCGLLFLPAGIIASILSKQPFDPTFMLITVRTLRQLSVVSRHDADASILMH